NCLPDRRVLRALCSSASLYRPRLLGGVQARLCNRRHTPRGSCRAADGGHCRILGAEPGLRSGDTRCTLVGPGAALLLACLRREAPRLLVPACACSRTAHARKLRGADPFRPVRRLHSIDAARSRIPASSCAVDPAGPSFHCGLSARALAERKSFAGFGGLRGERRRRGTAGATQLAVRRAAFDASWARAPCYGSERLAASPPRAQPGDRATSRRAALARLRLPV